METLITFETAKTAKEKGFDLLTEKYWCNYYAGLPINKWKLLPKNETRLNFMEFPASIQSILQRWLREEKDIDVLIESIGGKKGYYFRLQEVSTGDLVQDSDIYGTYEEALEQGLLEALNLI